MKNDSIVYIQNDQLRLGVNLELGGAVTYLSEHGKKNLINSFDWGRQVQMSFYGGPNPYKPQGYEVNPDWEMLGWNPIQSGDCFNNKSTLLDHRVENGEIYVKCIPMQWPMKGCAGECTFEAWYRLEGNTVKVRSRLCNDREDKTQYPAHDQELPAVYTNGEWYKLVSYIGNAPCTDDSITELCNKENGLGWPWVNYKPTEGWAALVDDNGYGLGVYNSVSANWIGGFAGNMGEGGEEKDFPTGYISPLSWDILDHNIQFDYEYSLIVGNIADIRAYAVENIKRENKTQFRFDKTRNHFSYRNTVDSGFPINGCLSFDYKSSDALIGPKKYYNGKDLHSVVIEGSFNADVLGTFKFFKYDGKFHKDGYNCGTYDIPFSMKAGESVCKLPVQCDGGFIGFELEFATAGHAKITSVSLL